MFFEKKRLLVLYTFRGMPSEAINQSKGSADHLGISREMFNNCLKVLNTEKKGNKTKMEESSKTAQVKR